MYAPDDQGIAYQVEDVDDRGSHNHQQHARKFLLHHNVLRRAESHPHDAYQVGGAEYADRILMSPAKLWHRAPELSDRLQGNTS